MTSTSAGRSFHESVDLGDFELSIFSDGTYPLDGGAFFGVVPRSCGRERPPPDEKNFVTAGLNSLLIRTGKQNILVETGIGNKLSDKMVKIYGQPAQLLENLAAGGVAPDDIDIVINTHLHFDHCGWNTMRKGDQRRRRPFPGQSITCRKASGSTGGAAHPRRHQLHQR